MINTLFILFVYPSSFQDDLCGCGRRPGLGADPQAVGEDRHRREGRRHQLAGLRRTRFDVAEGQIAAGRTAQRNP